MKALLVLIGITAGLLGLTACQPTAAATESLPNPTLPVSTETATPTIVWFPPTDTPTPYPTQVVTPTLDIRPQVGEIILTDDFTSPSMWTLGRTPVGSIALGVNELTLAISQPKGYLYSLRQGEAFTDFYLEITASPSICRDKDEYGLLVRVSPSLDFYRFSLSCNGTIRVDKYFMGKASSPIPPAPSGAVPPGAPSVSRLAVWAKGKEMLFFVNEQYQFTVRDPSLVTGYLGLFARSEGDNVVTVSFSDLVLRRVPR